jgi:uncharacterized membrane protein YccC
MGGQQQFQQSQFGQAVAQSFSQSVPNEVVQAVNDLSQLSTVSEWAHSQAMNRGNTRVARVCADIQEITQLQKKLILRQSQLAQPIVQSTIQSLQSAIAQLQQHSSEPGVQEIVSMTQQVTTSVPNALSRLQTFAGQSGQTFGGQSGQTFGSQSGQPFGGQSGQFTPSIR